MKILLDFSTENAAFQDEPEHEITRIMDKAKEKVQEGVCDPDAPNTDQQWPLLDTNGNTIGAIHAIKDTPDSDNFHRTG